MTLTGQEAAQNAKKYKDLYKYIYGAKGEVCSAAHIEELISQYTSYFTPEKAAAARQKAGYNCADCSGYVCISSGYRQIGSWALYEQASERRVLTVSQETGKVLGAGTYVPLGAIVWKPGHVGIYVGDQKVVESRSESDDVVITDIRQRDFTYCLLLPGIDYAENSNDSEVGTSSLPANVYAPWIGKIVNVPSVSPESTPGSGTPAYGFGQLSNGSAIQVVGISGNYYRVRSAEGRVGYVNAYYIGTMSDPAYANAYVRWTGVVSSQLGYVNIRTGPGTGYAQHANVSSLTNGCEVTVMGEVMGSSDQKLWYYVQIMGIWYGYIRADLLRRKVIREYTPWLGKAQSTTGTVNIRQAPMVTSALSAMHAPLSNGDAVTVLNEEYGPENNKWYAVMVDGIEAGYIRADIVIPYVEDYYPVWDGVIAAPTSGANLRSQPTTASPVVTGSPFVNGTPVRVTGETLGGDGYTWYALRVGNVHGYCRCDLIAATEDYPQWTVKAETATGTLNIRTGMGTGYSQLAACPSVANGTLLVAVSQGCGTDGRAWLKVRVNGNATGYVRADLVKPVRAAAYPFWKGYASSGTGVVNVRSAPSTAAAVIEDFPQLLNGQEVLVFDKVDGSDGYLWFHIRITGPITGYVRSNLITHER